MLTPYSPKLVCTGRQWSARVGRRPWRCRCGLPHWWPPVLADAVAVRRGGVRPCGWCTGWRSLPLVSVRRAGGRSVAGVRPWPCWPFSWPVAAFWPSAGPLVRRGPFVARGGPFGPCVLALSFGSVPPPLVARRRWCAVLVLACLVCAVGGRGGRVAGRPCWCRWCRCHCAVPWPVARVAGRQYGPPCGGVLVVSLRRALLGRVPCPSVRAGVRRGGRWPCPSVRAGVLVCGRWLASVSCRIPWPWRPVWAVGGVGVRRWSLRPVWALFWALPTGWPCGPCQWWRRWLAVLALAVVLALSKNVGPWLAGGGPCAVLSVVVVSACLACGPCWCRTSGGRGRPSNQRTNTSGRRGGLAGGVVLLACAGVGGAGVGGHVLAPVGPRAAAVGRRAVGVAY